MATAMPPTISPNRKFSFMRHRSFGAQPRLSARANKGSVRQEGTETHGEERDDVHDECGVDTGLPHERSRPGSKLPLRTALCEKTERRQGVSPCMQNHARK